MSDHRKQLADALESSDSDRIVRALEEMASEVHALWQIMSEFHQDVVHVLRNRPLGFPCESEQWKATANVIPESICCEQCDASLNSLAEALQEGWINLCRDDGLSWNYLGQCPDCQEAEAEEDQRTQERLAAARTTPEESSSDDSGRWLF